MAKTILTGKEVKKLPFPNCFAIQTSVQAIIPWLTKYLFVRYRPGDTGNRNCKQKKPSYL